MTGGVGAKGGGGERSAAKEEGGAVTRARPRRRISEKGTHMAELCGALGHPTTISLQNFVYFLKNIIFFFKISNSKCTFRPISTAMCTTQTLVFYYFKVRLLH